MTIDVDGQLGELRSLRSELRDDLEQRTAEPLDLWIHGRATQVAAAWVLSTLFVPTLEDRGYMARRRIAGPGADDSEQQFVAVAPSHHRRPGVLALAEEARWAAKEDLVSGEGRGPCRR
jgi:hypothetical protein